MRGDGAEAEEGRVRGTVYTRLRGGKEDGPLLYPPAGSWPHDLG